MGRMRNRYASLKRQLADEHALADADEQRFATLVRQLAEAEREIALLTSLGAPAEMRLLPPRT